ncbi:MAG: mechanosensitive ion channel, partial [Muribaculum sp.]|nr:mechanosensitive ion channel [Muribaculum sp.]
MVSGMVEFAIHLCIAILVFYVGRFIISKLYKIVESIFIRRQIDHSLTTFILSMVRIVLYFILIVTVIGILGIETSSFLALFASAGVAVGLALSGTLQNFAGGVLILLLKPYRIGDYIEAQGFAGTVKEIQVFSTILTTPDNKSIIIPNGGLSTGSINNYSREDYRRVDWTVSISYGDSVENARQAILDMLHSDHRIVKRYVEDDRRKDLTESEIVEADRAEAEAKQLEADRAEAQQRRDDRRVNSWWGRLTGRRAKVKTLGDVLDERHRKALAMLPRADRSPVVYVSALADSSVNLTVRAWTRSELYW